MIRTVQRHAFGRRRRLPSNEPAPAFVDRAVLGGGLVLGRRLRGERALDVVDGQVVISPDALTRHVLIAGATGSGKTESAMRLAWAVAVGTDAPVFFLDGKGDRRSAERFCGLMQLAGRQSRVFPNQSFDGWRGSGREIANRLLEIVDYSSEGPAAWYRDVAKTTVGLVCDHPDGPPRSSAQVLFRMDRTHLLSAHGPGSGATVLTNDLVRQVRLRYEAFFAHIGPVLDGGWAWEDAGAAYLLLDSLALREEAVGLARFLFEDFAHFFTSRKPADRLCVLIVDEFSSLAQSGGMASRVEQARGYNAGLVLCPQVVAGMGDETEAARILGSVQTVICHRVNTPEDLVALAGTRLAPERSSHIGPDGFTGEGSARMQHQYRVDPNEVRRLKAGEAFLISQGRAMKARIHQAPQAWAPLPAPEPASDMPPRATATAPTPAVKSAGDGLAF